MASCLSIGYGSKYPGEFKIAVSYGSSSQKKMGLDLIHTQILISKEKWTARRWVFRAPCAPGPFYTVPGAPPSRSAKVCMSFVSSWGTPPIFMRIYGYIYIQCNTMYYIYIHSICIYIVCMYVCTYVCMYACLSVCLYVCMYVGM